MPERIVDFIEKLQDWPYLILGITQVVRDWMITNIFNILKVSVVVVGTLFALYATSSSLITTVEANTRVLKIIETQMTEFHINQRLIAKDISTIGHRINKLETKHER
jgi:hypothetical protein